MMIIITMMIILNDYNRNDDNNDDDNNDDDNNDDDPDFQNNIEIAAEKKEMKTKEYLTQHLQNDMQRIGVTFDEGQI